MEGGLIQTINGYIDNKAAHFRTDGKELFMRLSSGDYVARRMANFLRENSRGIVSTREVLRELLSMQKSHFYLETPALWIAASLPVEGEIPQGIPEVGGRIISCRAFLHPQDPLFRDGNIFLTGEKHSPYTFNTRHGEYIVSGHAFSQFCDRAPSSEYFKKAQGVDLDTRRGLLKLLFKEFQGSIPVERRNTVSQIINHGFRDSTYRTNHGWIYVVENGKILKTCYDKENPSAEGYVVPRSR